MTVTRTLCLTDVVDSTQLAGALGDRRNGDLWDAHDRVARALVARWNGVELERTDGIMVMFEHPADAVAFALAYQEGVRGLEPPLVARAGIHAGPLVVRANPPEHVARGAKRVEVDGLAIAMTARVMSLALGGQTLLTVDAVPPALGDGVRLVAHGHWRLKGVPDPVEVLEIGAEGAPFTPPPDAPKAWRVVRRGDGWLPARQVGTSLPPEPDAFVGRAAELRGLAEALDGGARVVSVLGPAGVGKTRLVTRYGWTWLGDWPGGVWFCDLGAARDPAGLRAALDRGLAPGGADGAGRLAGLGRALLVLDRLDPALGSELGGLLAGAPEVQVVATGTEPPGVRGEVVLTLAAPPLEEAVALFVRRATAASKEFDPSPEEREVVATLVARLERMPLAVELAAAQIRTAPPRVLLARMEATSTRLLTLVSLEIVDALAARQRLGERAYAEAVDQHDAVMRRALAETGDGEQLENAGDALLLVFATPSSAVRFALRARAALQAWSAAQGVGLADRFAVHLGEVVVRGGVRAQASLATDTTARLRALSDAGRVLLTRAVFDNARQHLTALGLGWWNHGDYALAGLDAPVEVCEVSEAADGPRAAPRDVRDARRVREADQDAVSGWRPAPELPVPGAPYVLDRALGEGAMGEVWLARHAATRELRVFKFCFGAERLRSLRREATLFQLLRDRVGAHPNLTFVREIRLDEPPCWIMVDHTDGVDLTTWWDAHGEARPPLAARLELVAQVADGLHAAHEAGVLHRDVKPANVLVEVVAGRPHARLTDFGIGQVTSSRLLAGLSATGLPATIVAGTGSSAAGTLMFMAPELVSGGPASVRSDVYALGVTLWQLVVGDLRRAPPMDWDRAIADELLREDLRRCFAGDPAERWETAGDLARSLRRLEVRRAERIAEEALAARDPGAIDRPHHLLELQLLRVGTTLRAGLAHTGPDNKGRLSAQRSDVALDPAGLATLHGDPEAYGRHLAARVLADATLRQRFLEVERAAQASGSFLRLAISIDPSAQELQELRWEQLGHPETGRPLSGSQHVLLSRHVLARDGQPMRLRGRTDLVAVVAVSAPSGERFAKSGLPPVDVEAEVARLRQALGPIAVRVVGGPGAPLTLPALLEALRGGVDVLCVVGHAAWRRATGAPMVLLQDAEGDAVPTEGEVLGARLSELAELPRLVLLTPPIPAEPARPQGSRPSAHSPLAIRVCDAGVPAVLAMQGPLSAETAAGLLPVFFAELARDGQVDRALAAARWRVRARPDAWMPALYSRVRDGRLWYTAGFRTGGESAEIWRRLLPAVRQGKLVPILGPGLLRNLLGVPADFALELARTHRFPLAAHDWDDLARVNQFLSVRESRFNVLRSVQDQMLAALVRRHGHWLPHEEAGPGKRPKLGRLLALASDHLRETQPGDPHRVLAELGASVYVTTTFDPLMERALKAAGREPQQVLTRWRYRKAPAPGDDGSPPRPSPESPVVYHAFGAFGVDDERSLVLTEDDFFDYLIGTTAGQLLPHFVQSALVDNSLLFLGFRLTDWTFRVLFRLMMNLPGRERLKDYCHVAVQLDPELETMEDVAGAKAYLAQYFGQESNIDIFWGSGPEFLTSLRAELARDEGPAPAPAAEEDDDGWDF